MPYQYIGKRHNFRGKSLWEILGNLKNFGIGRIVVRSKNDIYPEPSYFKILKVETHPKADVETIDNLRKVRVLAEATFRGRTLPEPVIIETVSYKTDFRLIPKDEETEHCQRDVKPHLATKLLPRTMEFPPLLKELVKREQRKNRELSSHEPQMKIIYNKTSSEGFYRLANEGEQPTEQFQIGLGKVVAPRLYKGINL